MSILLYVIGALAVVAGVLLAAFGLPVSEFSFGNTLIMAGATLGTGGLVLIGLGAVVSKLQHIAENLATQLPAGTVRPMESFEAGPAARAGQGRAPFPPKPKFPPVAPSAPVPEVQAPQSIEADLPADIEVMPAPTLRNPDVPPLAAEEASLSPLAPSETGKADFGAPSPTVPPVEPPHEPRQEPTFDSGWRPAEPEAEPRGRFDSVWPAEDKAAKTAPEPAIDLPPQPEMHPEDREPAGQQERPPVAVLKSGIVDGMAYTLYVDGSIDAELPQGTLHFASIDDLRSHIEKST